LNARGERVVGQLFKERKCGAGLAVVEDDAGAGRSCGDEVDGGAEGFEGEVGDDSSQAKKAGDCGLKPAE